MNEWRNVTATEPPDNMEVEVMNNGGARLVRRRNLWFFPDFSMYVYYTPQYWRPIES